MHRHHRLIPVALLIAVFTAGCGGDSDSETSFSGSNTAAADTASDPDPVAGVDLASAPEPPPAGRGGAAVTVDGVTTDFDGDVLGLGQCEVSDDRIAVRIGQSGPWLAFEAQRSGGVWSQGPSWQPADDPPQHEGMAVGAEIVVDGSTVTFRGEVVIQHDPLDFASWERTVGALTIDCGS